MHGQVTFVTSRGRRVVSVAVAEAATHDSQAAGDAATATMYAANSSSTRTGAAPPA